MRIPDENEIADQFSQSERRNDCNVSLLLFWTEPKPERYRYRIPNEPQPKQMYRWQYCKASGQYRLNFYSSIFLYNLFSYTYAINVVDLIHFALKKSRTHLIYTKTVR